MSKNRKNIRQTGFILLPVILLLAVIGAVALMMTQKGLVDSKQARNSIDSEQDRYSLEAAFAIAKHELELDEDCVGYSSSITGNGIFMGQNYTANVSVENGSPVTLTVQVDGSTRKLSREIRMYDPNATTDYTVNAEQDTHVRLSNTETNYNTGSEADRLHVMRGTGLQSERISLIQFDLDEFTDLDIPIANLQSATLELHTAGSPEANVVSMTAFLIKEDQEWKEDEAIYYQRLSGVAWSFVYIDLISGTSTQVDENITGWKTWSFLSMVTAWLDDTYENRGIGLFGEAGNSNNIEFVSLNDPDNTKHPLLRITYSGAECS